MRGWASIMVGLVVLLPTVVPSTLVSSTSHADDSAAEQAAKEIADARDRANAAADALFEAESQLDTLQLAQEGLQAEIAALQQQIDELRRNVEAVAINRFTRSGTSSLPLLTGFRNVGDQAQVDVLIDVVNETSADDFDQFDVLVSEVEDKQHDLADVQAATEAARTTFDQRRQNALAEVELLKEVEADRLQDEAVRKALEAEQAVRRQLADAQARAEAKAQQAQNNAGQPAAPVATVGGDSPDDASSGGDGDIDDSGGNAAATGGTGGGQTGTLGIGGRPGSSPGDLAGDGWICPVQGVVSFGDTWGAPRSGGRTHQGVDMIGNRGLPVVAVVDGFAQQKVNTLGGTSVWLSGADGNKYYYAHLDSWAAQGNVAAGTIIGYLGDTGNAKFSVPHLHFEIHPGGGSAVNPFPTTRAHC